MTLPTMKAGDRVRITVEGEVKEFEDGIYTMSLYGGMIAEGEARYIHRFGTGSLTAPTTRVEVLPPPIDPDLVLAREVCATRASLVGLEPQDFLSGEYDGGGTVKLALAAIKASKAGGRV